MLAENHEEVEESYLPTMKEAVLASRRSRRGVIIWSMIQNSLTGVAFVVLFVIGLLDQVNADVKVLGLFTGIFGLLSMIVARYHSAVGDLHHNDLHSVSQQELMEQLTNGFASRSKTTASPISTKIH